MLYRIAFVLLIIAQANGLACNLAPRPAPRSAVLRMQAASPAKAATVTMDAAADAAPKAAAQVDETAAPLDARAQLDKDISAATDNNAVLDLAKANIGTCSVNTMAAALKKLAIINKKRRAGRDALLRDKRFEMLIDGIVEQSKDLEPASTADVLWSSATLQHWPATMLSPVLTSVAMQVSTQHRLSPTRHGRLAHAHACAHLRIAPVRVSASSRSLRPCVHAPLSARRQDFRGQAPRDDDLGARAAADEACASPRADGGAGDPAD